jgi:hypothetical protein
VVALVPYLVEETLMYDDPEYIPGPLDIEFNENLAALARAQAYAEELVEDDYLWTDATADYCRVKIGKLLQLLGAS